MKKKSFIRRIWIMVAFIAIFSLGIAGCSTSHDHPTGDHPASTSDHPSEEKPASDHPDSEHPE